MADSALNREVNELGLLKNLVRVTGEIASGRMQRARDGVLYRREFLNELFFVFHEVQRGLKQKMKGLTQSNQGKLDESLTKLMHNGKNVAATELL